MPSFMRVIDDRVGYPLRCRNLVRKLAPYLYGATTVLDLGSSSGRLAQQLSKALPGVSFSGVDTCVQPVSFIPVSRSDGKKLPFPDASFDCVMMVDVLHHDTDPWSIMMESARVARKFVLIKDHYWKSRLDFLTLKYSDYIGNKPYDVSLPYNFLRMEDWEGLISSLGLKVVASERFRYKHPPMDMCRQVIFRLQK